MEQWRRYTALFPHIEIEVLSIECIELDDGDSNNRDATAAIVVGHSRMRGQITTQTVATVLPHVSHDASLVAALLGRTFTCPTQLRFFFNAAGRIVRLELRADFCEGFSTLDGLSLRDELLALHLNRLLNTGRRDYVVSIASGYYSTFRTGYLTPRLGEIQRYCRALVLRLIDQTIDCPIHLQFHFNAAGRIVRLEFDADFTSAFMRLNGISLLDVVRIMEQAEVAENSIVPALHG
ncbi:hypothetical protein ATCC90586_007510 [Pythium insidiosum]|nr:hypothetical protein ATCC90586_007510 [Pythium insidiosum]